MFQNLGLHMRAKGFTDLSQKIEFIKQLEKLYFLIFFKIRCRINQPLNDLRQESSLCKRVLKTKKQILT